MITIDTNHSSEIQILHLISYYKHKHEEMERIDRLFALDDSPEIEAQWNEAYKEEWNAMEAMVKAIVGATGLSPKVIRAMVITREAELFQLLELQ